MKTFKISMVILAMLLSAAGFSQVNDAKFSKQDRKEDRSERMVEKLDLTDIQRKQIAKMREENRVERQRIKNNMSLDKTSKRAAMQNMRKNNQLKMNEVLSPQQSVKLAEMRSEKRKNNSKQRAGKDSKKRQTSRKTRVNN